MKLFIFSDCHGYANELKLALDEAGFEKDNKDHLLIGCGDYFDRGGQPFQVMNYLNSIKNKVLIKGNHESLLLDCIKRRYPLSHDIHNGTAATIIDLAVYFDVDKGMRCAFDEACEAVEKPVKRFVKQMVNYYETENYLFVHSFVPLHCDDDFPVHYTKGRRLKKMDDWREKATKKQWEQARWHNPFELANNGFLPDKILVFGHWNTSYAWSRFDGSPEFEDGAKFDIFHGDGYTGLDACTAYTGKVNVLVVEDNLLTNEDNML